MYKIGLPGKSILEDYFQENMTSRKPFLLLRISFPGRPIFIQLPPDEGGNFALEGKPPLPPTEGPGGTGTGAGGTGTVPKPPPRTRPKSWTSSLFNAMSRQNHKSVNFQSVLEEQQQNSQNSQAEILVLKHDSRILGQWSNPVVGSWKSQASSPWAKQHRV